MVSTSPNISAPASVSGYCAALAAVAPPTNSAAKILQRIDCTFPENAFVDTVLHKSLHSAAVNEAEAAFLRQSIRTIADYPKPGIQFRDITTLLRDARAFELTVDALIEPWRDQNVDKVAGIEARGFILGGAVAHGLRCGFVPIRKRGKLPHETVRVAYSLEYGVDEMEMHTDAIRAGERVLLIDDLIATGGTATGAASLLQSAGAQVCAACFVIDLPGLGGAARLGAAGISVQSLLTF
jgi:adenine phosphoribosyltransferase